LTSGFPEGKPGTRKGPTTPSAAAKKVWKGSKEPVLCGVNRDACAGNRDTLTGFAVAEFEAFIPTSGDHWEENYAHFTFEQGLKLPSQAEIHGHVSPAFSHLSL
jgi:hypothetical protein